MPHNDRNIGLDLGFSPEGRTENIRCVAAATLPTADHSLDPSVGRVIAFLDGRVFLRAPADREKPR